MPADRSNFIIVTIIRSRFVYITLFSENGKTLETCFRTRGGVTRMQLRAVL